jgi:hypothetical protein
MTVEYKVPRLLWENFESTLYAHSKRYVSELAKRLQVPEKELIKKVLPSSDSLKVMILDSQLESNKCKAYIQEDKLTIFCKKPVAYQSEYCTFHRNKRMFVVPDTEYTEIQKVSDINTIEALWKTNQYLINSSGEIKGIVNQKENKIKLFVVTE